MEPASLAVNGIDPYHPLRPAIPEEDALQRIFREVRTAVRAADCTRAVLVGPQRVLRSEFPQCRGRAHPDQAQSVPSVLELRHRDARGRRVRPDGADACDAGRGPRMGHGVRAFGGLRRGAHARTVLHGVQSVPGGVRGQPAPAGRDGTARDRTRTDPADPGPTGETESLGGRHRAGFGQQLLQFAALVHLERDVAAADQLAIDVELRKRRPVRVASSAPRALPGSSKMLTWANCALQARSAPTVWAEKPHCGKSGVPFMYSTTGAADSWLLIRSMASHRSTISK